MGKSVGFLTIMFGANLKGFTRAMKKAQRTIGKFGRDLKNTGRNLTRNITLPIIGLGTVAVKTFANFEQAMLKVKAVSGATDTELKSLTNTAKQLGASTMFTASQVAGLQFELSKLGFSAEEINLSTESILALSQATTHDLAESGEIVASTLKSFGKEAKDAAQVADIMAFASSNSAMNMEKFANAMPVVGATANTVGVSLEQLTSQFMVLADRGIQASSMGTHLRKIFAELEIRGLTLEQAMTAINDSTDKTTLATELFGKRAFNTAIILAENINQQKKYEAQLKSSEGAAKSMAEIMDSGTQGALRRLKSALEGLAIDLGQMLIPLFEKLINALRKAIDFWKNLDHATKNVIITLGLVAGAVGPILVVFGSMVTLFASLLTPVNLVISALVVGGILIVKNWEKVKPILVDIINYFIELYNESTLFRGSINLIIATFKNMWAGAKFAFNLIWKLGSNMIEKLVARFKALAKIVKGALTGDPAEIKEGMKEYGAAVKDGIIDSLKIAGEESKIFADEVAKNFKEAVVNTLIKDKIEYISEDDIDDTVESAKNMAEKVLKQFQKMFGTDGGGGGIATPNFDNGQIPFLSAQDPAPFIGPMNEKLKETASIMDILNEKFGISAVLLQEMGTSLGATLSEGADDFKEYTKLVKNSIRDTIGALIAQGVTTAVTNALKSTAFLPPFLIPVVAGAAAGLAKTAFRTLIPAFAQGGLVTGPTLGLIGEGMGTNASNPEVIAPLDKLKGMINGGVQQVEVYGRISGNDIFISNQRGSINRLRSV